MKEKTGLWQKKSKKGTTYYSGKIIIEGKEYSIAIFKNDKKQDKSPDLMLYYEEKQKEKTSYTPDEVLYDKNFGKDISDEITDDMIGF